jgi:hypothetical protein
VRTVLSSLAWVSEVEYSLLEVPEFGVQADVVVLIDELLHFALGYQIVVAVVVISLSGRTAPFQRPTMPLDWGGGRARVRMSIKS